MKRILGIIAIAGLLTANAQVNTTNKTGGQYEFTSIYNLDATKVENQYRSGTCWSFSTLSFFESELIRTGKGKHELSEMFIVRNAYVGKAEKYVRMHGNTNFGAGGAFHDIPWVIKRYGIVPQEAYEGLNYGTSNHMHNEMDQILKAIVDAVISNPNGKLTSGWISAFKGALDAYLGTPPTEFKYQGKKYTPQSFAKSLDLNMDDYVSLTSFSHFEDYKPCQIAVPDNWVWGSSYNVPLQELWDAMEYALAEGYTFAWGADVSEKGFSYRDGLAIVPKDPNAIIKKGKDNKHFSDAGAEKIGTQFDAPGEELEITPELRQAAYDNYETQDDHGMHITGLVKDQNGTKYLVVKNSWGASNDCDGYFYASEAYTKYKTLNIYLHKDALSKDLKKKLGIQ